MMKKQLAVVGSGISGLAAAWLLANRHEVHLFEKRERLGGHTHTVPHTPEDSSDTAGALSLDTGFIVFNELTYPTLTRVFSRLGVRTQTSDMSFAISCKRPDVEYSGSSLRALLAQPTNLLRPRFLRLLVDIARFGRVGRRCLEAPADPSVSLGSFLSGERFGTAFGALFLLPMAAAIWSTGTGPTADIPRDTLLRFFDNHGLLSINDQPEWKTVVGGSSSYIPMMTREYQSRVHLGCGIVRVERRASDVVLHLGDGSKVRFDHVALPGSAADDEVRSWTC